MELAPYRIRVNAIAPGLTDTLQPRLGLTEEEISNRANNSPLGRIVFPEEVADLAAFLASPKAEMITGQTHHINSGAYIP